MSDFSSLTVLVSGAGSIGKRHMKNLELLGVGHIVSYDPKFPSVDDFDTALAKVSPHAVFICSPTKEHIPQAIAAAKSNAHLFIEKPLSHTMEHVDELKRLVADQKNLITMVGCNMRFHPGPKMVKELLEKEVIGKVTHAEIQTYSYLPDWRPNQDYRKSYSADPLQGGAILDCIHEIDLALWYLGPGTLQSASTVPATDIGLTVEGQADLVIDHEQGATSAVHLSFMHKGHKRSCTIAGERGTISWDIAKKTVEHTDTAGNLCESFAEPDAWELNNMYKDEVAYFLKHVQNGEPTFSPLTKGREALAIAIAARRKNSL